MRLFCKVWTFFVQLIKRQPKPKIHKSAIKSVDIKQQQKTQPRMALRYVISFKTKVYAKDYILNIYDENYSGEPVELSLGASGIVMRKDSDGIFRGTSLDISIQVPESETWGLPDLFSSHSRQHRVELQHLVQISQSTTIPETIWSGFLVPEEYSDPLVNPPFDITLRAVDGIGTLKDYDFGIPETASRKTLIEVIAHCFANLGLQLPISTAVHIWHDGQSTSSSTFLQTKISPSAFYDSGTPKKCDEVLRLILQSFDPDVTITQAFNRWVITRRINIADNSYYHHDSEGNYSSISSLTSEHQLFSQSDYAYGKCFPIDYLTRNILPQPRTFTLHHNYGHRGNILRWGIATDDPGQHPEGYNPANTYSTIWRNIDTWNRIRYDIDGKFKYWTFGASALYYPNNNYQQVYATTRYTKLVFKIRNLGSDTTIGVRIMLSGTTNKWLSSSGWVSSASTITLNIATSGGYEDKTIIIDSFPNDGLLAFELYTASQTSFNMSEFRLEMYQDDEQPYPESVTHVQSLQQNAINTVDIEAYGDGDFDDNGTIFYKNIFTRSDNNRPTSSWRMLADSTYVPLINILSRSVASNYRQTRQRITGSLMGQDLTMHSIISYPNNGNRKFVIETAAHDLRNDEIEVELSELLPYSETAVTLTTTYNN